MHKIGGKVIYLPALLIEVATPSSSSAVAIIKSPSLIPTLQNTQNESYQNYISRYKILQNNYYSFQITYNSC